jgi:THO complex subunit 4
LAILGLTIAKIEVIVGAADAPAAPVTKSLGDRIQKPAEKAKPKPATAAPKAAAGGKVGKVGKARARGGKGKAGAGRPKPKTAEELDAEMADYFGNGDAAMSNGGAVQPAAGGDTGMEDDVVA